MYRTVVRCVIRDVLQYVLVVDYDIRCSGKRKSYTLKLKLEAGEPGGSNISRVSKASQVSNRSRGSDGIVLIQAGGNTVQWIDTRDSRVYTFKRLDDNYRLNV